MKCVIPWQCQKSIGLVDFVYSVILIESLKQNKKKRNVSRDGDVGFVATQGQVMGFKEVQF